VTLLARSGLYSTIPAVAKAPGAIDIHAHYFPERYLDLLERSGGAFGASVDRSNAKGPAIAVRGSRTPPLDASYWDLDRRRKAMDRQGVAVHALSLTVPMVYFADGELGQRLAEAVNDSMSEAHRAFPDRFVGCATLPMQDPKRAVAEIERVATLPGIKAIYLGTNVNARELSDAAFGPVFGACEARRLPVLLHPINVIGAARLGTFYLNNLLGNPFDTAVAAAHLVFGGVLDRHPKLEVCLPHAGGALPYLVGRLQPGKPEGREQAVRRLPPPLHVRHDQSRAGIDALSDRSRRRRSRHARQRLLLRHGTGAAAGDRRQAAAALRRRSGPHPVR
jgi:aminocarboxymuconate-semialdehyde decarboxylase